MSLIDGIQALFGATFQGIYKPGQLTRRTLVPDGVGGGSVTPSPDQAIFYQKDACTETMRTQAGYTDRDVRLLILQHNVAGGDINSDCVVTLEDGTRYKIEWVTEDPAESYWECRATPAKGNS